ncbi:MAG: hypothetical protein HQL01_00595 [Nitrospirae bacterium]|nr:hypothetical protein [Nitrospirota bacterium]
MPVLSSKYFYESFLLAAIDKLSEKLSRLSGACGRGLTLNRECGESLGIFLIDTLNAAANVPQFSRLKEMARQLNAKIALAGEFITPFNAEICPQCNSVCCLNKFGCYDFDDLIYMGALGCHKDEFISFANNAPEDLPCRYLTQTGCTISRQLRPFRCNWFFCAPLVQHMENGSMKAYRGFNRLFQEIIRLRKDMLDEFSAAINILSGAV